ncbi:MAG TPA: ArsA family ATPase [Acidimicrobiales bacterium]|nr:ArsA family ATPase [Acidimicrobiales bacterium]
MDVASFCRQSRVVIVAGKGGVGKTTMTAAIARVASGVGLEVLIIELEGKSGLAEAFGHLGELEYEDAVLIAPREGRGRVRARRITPDDALLQYLADHGMKRISRRLVSSGALDIVGNTIPGIKDILVLGRVKQLERDGAADLILVDAPATGHAMTFLSSARGLLDAARSGPVRAQAQEVAELLGDPTRCRVMLVTLAEEMPVNETIESAYKLEDDLGVELGPVIVNESLASDEDLTVQPAAAAAEEGITLSSDQANALQSAAKFHLHRVSLQEEQLERLGSELPLPQLRAPFVYSDSIGPYELEELARGLTAEIENLDERGLELGPLSRPGAGP